MNGHVINNIIAVNYCADPQKSYIHFLTDIKWNYRSLKDIIHEDVETVYTSQLNAAYLSEHFNVPGKIYVGLNEGRWYSFATKREVIKVLLARSYYSPGSTLFLFHGKFGYVLYTGNCRINVSCDSLKQIINYTNGQPLASIYLDSTHVLSNDLNDNLLPLKEAVRQTIAIVKAHHKNRIILASGNLVNYNVVNYLLSVLKCNIFVTRRRCSLMKHDNNFLYKNHLLTTDDDDFDSNVYYDRNYIGYRLICKDFVSIRSIISDQKTDDVIIYFTNRMLCNSYKEHHDLASKLNERNIFIVEFSNHSTSQDVRQLITQFSSKNITLLNTVISDKNCDGDWIVDNNNKVKRFSMPFDTLLENSERVPQRNVPCDSEIKPANGGIVSSRDNWDHSYASHSDNKVNESTVETNLITRSEIINKLFGKPSSSTQNKKPTGSPRSSYCDIANVRQRTQLVDGTRRKGCRLYLPKSINKECNKINKTLSEQYSNIITIEFNKVVNKDMSSNRNMISSVDNSKLLSSRVLIEKCCNSGQMKVVEESSESVCDERIDSLVDVIFTCMDKTNHVNDDDINQLDSTTDTADEIPLDTVKSDCNENVSERSSVENLSNVLQDHTYTTIRNVSNVGTNAMKFSKFGVKRSAIRKRYKGKKGKRRNWKWSQKKSKTTPNVSLGANTVVSRANKDNIGRVQYSGKSNSASVNDKRIVNWPVVSGYRTKSPLQSSGYKETAKNSASSVIESVSTICNETDGNNSLGLTNCDKENRTRNSLLASSVVHVHHIIDSKTLKKHTKLNGILHDNFIESRNISNSLDRNNSKDNVRINQNFGLLNGNTNDISEDLKCRITDNCNANKMLLSGVLYDTVKSLCPFDCSVSLSREEVTAWFTKNGTGFSFSNKRPADETDESYSNFTQSDRHRVKRMRLMNGSVPNNVSKDKSNELKQNMLDSCIRDKVVAHDVSTPLTCVVLPKPKQGETCSKKNNVFISPSKVKCVSPNSVGEIVRKESNLSSLPLSPNIDVKYNVNNSSINCSATSLPIKKLQLKISPINNVNNEEGRFTKKVSTIVDSSLSSKSSINESVSNKQSSISDRLMPNKNNGDISCKSIERHKPFARITQSCVIRNDHILNNNRTISASQIEPNMNLKSVSIEVTDCQKNKDIFQKNRMFKYRYCRCIDQNMRNPKCNIKGPIVLLSDFKRQLIFLLNFDLQPVWFSKNYVTDRSKYRSCVLNRKYSE